MRLPVALSLLLTALSALPLHAAEPLLPKAEGYESREDWRRPIAPFAIADRTSYIGTEGLSAVLIRTDAGADV